MSTELGGCVAVVTGAAAGLGLATARALAGRGARLVLLDIDQGRLASASATLADAGVDVTTRVCDVTQESEVVEVFASLGERCDILVNSAGIIGHTGPLDECPMATLDTVLAVNVRGTLLCCREALRIMRFQERGGAIVNIASTSGLAGSVRLGTYALSKAAVVSMTRSLAIAEAPRGIRVNAVCPGSIDSEMFDRSLVGPDFAAERAAIVARHPLGRLGTVEEVAETAAFLASPGAGFITGVALPVDGGRLA